ncbi:MAG: helix-turn-helix transcriptional regulator [Spirosomataceae bacterium]|jgi:DNA-binding XRE family transcriptional regulator|nr:helix-turn-helix transcriptional regulator [Flectobacillus sp.]
MELIQLGHIIRDKRNELDLTQEMLSLQSDVAIKTIHSIELGKANPSVKTLSKLLDTLKLSLIVINRKIN